VANDVDRYIGYCAFIPEGTQVITTQIETLKTDWSRSVVPTSSVTHVSSAASADSVERGAA
jgi:hypothetical protein